MEKTNYDILREESLKDKEIAAYYAFAKEKLNLELLVEEIKDSVKKNTSQNTTLKKIRNLSRHIGNIAM